MVTVVLFDVFLSRSTTGTGLSELYSLISFASFCVDPRKSEFAPALPASLTWGRVLSHCLGTLFMIDFIC